MSVQRLVLFAIVPILLAIVAPGIAEAKDVRLALLIANQKGWDKDPLLRYAVSGDLLPMSRTLKNLGFKVHATLANRSASTIRQVFRQILQRVKQKPRVTTFFFYYSGHADKAYFHTGKRGKNPLSFQEFVWFLDKLRVKRRFAVVDACFSGEIIRRFGSLKRYKHLRQTTDFRRKGIRRQLVETDLSKHLSSQGNNSNGLQIISSSQDESFESRKYKSSVFTHFFLQGLKKQADFDNDGKISLNELFLYTKPRVKQKTGQSPQQWLFREGSDVYAFAPAYKSTLLIGSKIRGELQVSVGNFVWHKHKTKLRPIRLSVTTGKGWVRLKRGKKCWNQQVHFPLQRRVSLQPKRWRKAPCSRVSLFNRKGVIQLPARPPEPLQQERTWLFEAQGGVWGSTGVIHNNGDLLAGGSFGFRHRYIALLLGLWGTSLTFDNKAHQQLAMELRVEGGYRGRWGNFDLFVGGYVVAGTLLQDINQNLNPGLFLHAGVTLSAAYWIAERFSLFIAVDGGFFPTIFDQPRLFFMGSVRFGVRFFLGGIR